ncbi:CPBP family intramembrane glutamic endopeptidase [Plantactinospora sp. WMMB782]|uniref:CPBP family intramembrane glutamic endopeptidase n=1 Tax=Plantactinospora sp. WMMB782 TaxID=3404121 RepID=UPI003B935560
MTVDLARPLPRRILGPEVLLVLGLSLGQSAIYSVVTITARLTADRPLSQQTAALNVSQSPRPWLDLTYQLLGIFFALVPVLLAVHLLNRDRILDRLSDRPLDRDGLLARDTLPDQAPGGDRGVLPDQGPSGDRGVLPDRSPDGARGALGLDVRRPGRDLAWGAALAAAIGLPGLGLFWIAAQLGVNATVVPASLPALWWTVPVLVLSAAQNAILEEVVVVGYLMTRLRQLGWRIGAVIAASALLRGSYHLYQGFGAFVGNAVMGVIFALFFLRTKRVLPLVVAHTLLDVVAFVGYALLPRDWFDWL